ncbi:hypothetical protein [Marinobacter salexigens]|uniref:Uncharacterized protein n=1 Tax=Marinobacter salexigens TaxID=1925763 RepID=A0ABS6AB43_9GAMM|nr:hypothetical protein [Marinobacter salexigens]MBU2875412.1 hypothetical protein [Marinobacter salexigens]
MGRKILCVGLALLYDSFAQAQESAIVTIEGTRIRGDQEVPTVMYLVPWQPAKVEELRAPDEQLMVEHQFAPLERYEFQRFVRYHEAFNNEQGTVIPEVQ